MAPTAPTKSSIFACCRVFLDAVDSLLVGLRKASRTATYHFIVRPLI